MLTSLALFGVLLAFALTGSDLLAARNHYQLELDHGTGLMAGTDVTIAGMRVGYVRDVQLTEQRTVALWLAIDETYAHHVREDSTGRVTMTLTGKTVIIEGGTDGAAPLADGGRLVGGTHFDMLIALEKMDLVHTLEKIQAILEDLTVLAKELQLGDGRLPDLVEAVLSIIEDLAAGRGALGTLLKDDDMLTQLDDAIENVNTMAQNVDAAALALSTTSPKLDNAAVNIESSIDRGVAHIGDASTSLDQTSKDVGKSADELQVTMGKLNEALEDLGVTMQAIQNLPLVRGQMKKIEEEEP